MTMQSKQLTMKNITAKDLRVKIGWKPKFLGMKEKDMYKVDIKSDCIFGYDIEGNEVYYEDLKGFWRKKEYKDGKQVYFENSDGDWWKKEYKDGREIYFENSKGDWRKKEYKDGKQVYSEDSGGDWWKKDGEDLIEFKNGKYYLNSEEAELIKND